MVQRSIMRVTVAVVLCFSLAAVALTICGSCGHEADPDSGGACPHCRAPLAVSVPPVTAPAPAAASPAGASIGASARELAAEDIADARRLYEAGDREVARLLCRNALALNLLTEAGPARELRAGQIMEMIEACERHEPMVRTVCPLCGGRNSNCRRCGGAGVLRRPQTINERKFERGQALQRYRVQQQGRTRVAMGGAWVPAAFSEALSVKEGVVLRRASAPGCRTCSGLGRIDCRTCSGLGTVDCRGAGCEGGVVTAQRDGLGGSSGFAVRSACQVCHGMAVTACGTCSGAGSMLCTACNGSGLPDACTRCGGDGLSACSRCRGSGDYRNAPCAVCSGGGVDLCRSCNGTGFRL